jgi:predicted MFS family arabinose efflux permease
MPAPAINQDPTHATAHPTAHPSAASGWRVPAAVVLLVGLVCLAIFLIVVNDLRTDANRQAAAQMRIHRTGTTAP